MQHYTNQVDERQGYSNDGSFSFIFQTSNASFLVQCGEQARSIVSVAMLSPDDELEGILEVDMDSEVVLTKC